MQRAVELARGIRAKSNVPVPLDRDKTVKTAVWFSRYPFHYFQIARAFMCGFRARALTITITKISEPNNFISRC